jgi:hypothetical protein
MDRAVTGATAAADGAAAMPALPPEAPVVMPTQSLERISLADVLLPDWARVLAPQTGRATSTA